MALSLFDSATRTLRPFEPLVAGKVGIYICGLTVQAPPHLGHIRFTVAFDQLRRWLTFGHGMDVTLVRNVTDIDDKILTKSAMAGQQWWARAYENERATTRALEALGVLPPSVEPRATGHVVEMVQMMEMLIEKGHAYVAPNGCGDVYFDVRSFDGYGALTHQAIDDLAPAGDADPRGKRDPRDFALWKGAKPGEPESASWPTPFGRGRPGWHLECSAMAWRYLGETFDIHGGGVDLRFPHHENERAQSQACGFGFANYWMHNGWVTVRGEKMSKSLGNSMVVSTMLEKHRPLVLRYYLGSAHYRSTMEFCTDSLDESQTALHRLERFVRRAQSAIAGGDTEPVVLSPTGQFQNLPSGFRWAMDDDLNVSGALGVVHDTVRAGNTALEAGDLAAVRESLVSVLEMTTVLGINPADEHWREGCLTQDTPERQLLNSLLDSRLEERATARAEKDFARADAIRDELVRLGVAIEDTASGARWTFK